VRCEPYLHIKLKAIPVTGERAPKNCKLGAHRTSRGVRTRLLSMQVEFTAHTFRFLFRNFVVTLRHNFGSSFPGIALCSKTYCLCVCCQCEWRCGVMYPVLLPLCRNMHSRILVSEPVQGTVISTHQTVMCLVTGSSRAVAGMALRPLVSDHTPRTLASLSRPKQIKNGGPTCD
jgi:hypothetical protein